MIFMNRVGIGLCVLTYAITQNTIDARYVFLVSSCYAIIRQTLTVYLAYGLSSLAEIRVTVERIRKFLMSNELPEKEPMVSEEMTPEEKPLIGKTAVINDEIPSGIHLENVSVKWVQSSPNYALHGVNFEARKNELVAITGHVGSGKSTLLYTILNELPLLQGQMKIGGLISYSSQEPWLFAGSLRQNILFGSKFDPTRYQKIVKICGLEEDFKSFPFGDDGIVGERGVLLSGGQKSRINLARAVYKDVDIYLLDDPFSAVDTKVGKAIFRECISEYLRDKCVVLVTHHLQYLGTVDKVYQIENGSLTSAKAERGYIAPNPENFNDFNSITDLMSNAVEKIKEKPKEAKEERKSGTVSVHVYNKYIQAGGSYCFVFFISLLFVLTQGFASGADYFLAFWVNSENSDDKIFTHQLCVYIYAGIVAFTVFVTIIRTLVAMRFCLKASKNLHDQMLSGIILAPMSIFNINPSGRILNRFSKDLGMVDELLPSLAVITFQIFFIVFGGIILISGLSHWLLVPSILITIASFLFRNAYMATSRNLQRLEATKRSPLYSHINKSLEGLTTIRSCNAQNILRSEFDNLQNLNTSAFYMIITCNRAFCFWLDMLCVWYTAIVIITIILTDRSAGNVGLGITQSINLIGVFQFGIKQWSEFENQMVSVERLVEYTEIAQEKTAKAEPPPPDWPSEGHIKFDSVSLQYTKNGPRVLREVSFTIHPKEKIGIVGRTGAGKSSLISALLRLFEYEGKITIDGVNVAEIALPDLRSKITIIPQEPRLFSGTLRKNLDPCGEFDDEELWKALEKAELKGVVSDLSSEIVECGSNYSTGQRQLLCLARAILKNNRILVLDEATASVDSGTDRLIQKVIKDNFLDCTVLTIAHRLHTVFDSDKVLVMDGGRIVEFGSIDSLMSNPAGMFYQLVKEGGNVL